MLKEAGILISAGHSNATYDQARAAFEAGIPTCTHLFNAMSGFQHRAPGLVGAIYDDAKVRSSIVADGIHVDFAAVRISYNIMKERLFFLLPMPLLLSKMASTRMCSKATGIPCQMEHYQVLH